MPTCVLRRCNTRSCAPNQPRISLFSFPEPHRVEREKWIQYVQKERSDEYWLPSDASKICAKHFKKEDINVGKRGRHTLKKCAIPYTANIDGTMFQSVTESQSVSPECDIISDSDSIFDNPKEIQLKLQLDKLKKRLYKQKIRTKKILRQNRYLKQKCLYQSKVLKRLQQKYSLDKH